MNHMFSFYFSTVLFAKYINDSMPYLQNLKSLNMDTGGHRVLKIDALGWGPDLYLKHQHLTTWK